MSLSLIFYTCLVIVFYTFVGYGLLMYCLVKLKIIFGRKKVTTLPYHPTCTVVIAAFNEEAYIRDKIINTLSLNYPPGQLDVLVVADGSTDRTVEIIKEFSNITLLFQAQRMGKVHAINRAMQYVTSEVVIFTDANTYLNANSLQIICNHYCDQKVGGVAGEKRILSDKTADASAAGESLYWRYESTLKRWDSDLNTAIGAAGELFSIRRNLYNPIPESIILDDFVISMEIVQSGYKIVYEPDAYAVESSSASIQEELKRKIRIAAGGMQSIIYLKSLLNFIRHPLLTFQYISHRVLRWSVTPFLIIILFIVNAILVATHDKLLYEVVWYSQIAFYFLAFLGYLLEKRKIKFKASFIPYYFCVMNYSVIAGIVKFLNNEQSAVWEKSARKQTTSIPSLTEDIFLN